MHPGLLPRTFPEPSLDPTKHINTSKLPALSLTLSIYLPSTLGHVSRPPLTWLSLDQSKQRLLKLGCINALQLSYQPAAESARNVTESGQDSTKYGRRGRRILPKHIALLYA
jgi:hypothetical protein